MPRVKDTAKVTLTNATMGDMVETWNAFNLDVTKERKQELMGLVWIPTYVNCFLEMIDS